MTIMMKATRIHAYGGPDAMRLEELPLPVPGPAQALVRRTETETELDWN